MTNKIEIPVTAELALAIEVGVKDAIKTLFGKEDPRSKVASTQELKGLKINMTLEVENLTIGQDTDRAPTVSIPLLPVLGLLVKQLGADRAAALAVIRKAMTEALNADESATKAILAESGVEQAVEQIKTEVISQLPRTKVAKAVKAQGTTLTITGLTQAQ